MKTKKFVTLSIVIGTVCVLASGAGGFFLAQAFSHKGGVSFDANTIDALEDDHVALMKKYESGSKTNLDKRFKPYELVNIAFENAGKHTFLHVKTLGEIVAMGVTQKFGSYLYKDYNNYFFESLSYSGIVQTAWRFYQDENTVKSYKGSIKTLNEVTWSDKLVAEQTLKEYEEQWGKTYSRPSIYIVSSKTVLDDGTTATDGEGNYVVTLNLNPSYSTARYVKQMVATSNLAKIPMFESVQIEYTISSDMQMKTIAIKEKYEVYKGLWVTSNANLKDEYTYDEEIKLPTMEEHLTY